MTPGPPDVDLLCVGAGIGGLVAALTAHDRGLRCLVVEASPLLGGVGAYSAGSVWVAANHVMARHGIADDVERAMAYLSFVGGDDAAADLELRRVFVTRGAEIVARLADVVPFSLSANSDQYHPWAPGSVSRGRSLDMGFPGPRLGRWRALLRASPYFPSSGLLSGEILDRGLDAPAAAAERDRLAAERRAADFLTGGQGLMAALVWATLVERAIPCLLDTRVVGLVRDGGRVAGVTVRGPDGTRTITAAGGVVLATGGYGHAPWAAEMEGLPAFVEQCPPVVHGDGLTLATGVGAAVARAGIGFPSAGIRSRTFTHPGTDVPMPLTVVAAMSYPHSMVVNARGQRFADESIFAAFSAAMTHLDGTTKRHANLPCFLLADDRYRQAGNVINGSGGVWPEDDLVRADSIAELAQRLGIDPSGLAMAIEKFNGYEATGTDPDFGRGSTPFTRRRQEVRFPHLANPLLGALREPPFWGAALVPVGTGICSHGLRIDPAARVLDWARRPVPGLFAAGSAVAFTELPFGYQDGIANSRSIVHGALAAESAAADLAATAGGRDQG